MRTFLVACLVVLIVSAVFGDPIIVGSKKFTESYVLAEIAKRAMEDAGITVEHRQGMGGTIILWEALRAGQISLYPEYTGTIAEEILKQPQSLRSMRSAMSLRRRESASPANSDSTTPTRSSCAVPKLSVLEFAPSAICESTLISSSGSRTNFSIDATAGVH